MKLYTEEQIRMLDINLEGTTIDEVINCLTPIYITTRTMKTAVEKFIEQLEDQGDSWENVSIGRIQISIKVEDYLKLKEQAKAMEKEQIIDAYYYDPNCDEIKDDGEQYYNETFKQQEQ